MDSMSPVDFEMVEFGVSKVKSISTVEVLGVLKFNFQLELSAANIREAEIDSFKAHTLESGGRVGRSGLSTENRQKLEGRVSRVIAVATIIDRFSFIIIRRVLSGIKLLS